MQPITLIPWHEDFIPALGQYLTAREDFSNAIVLFPHNRPRRYLKAFFKMSPDLARPVFLPEMTSIAEFVAGLRRTLTDKPVFQENRLDLVEHLFGIVHDLRRNGRGLLARLPELDREAFLPWGIRLANLMDDLMRQDITPEDLKYMEGEVSPYASAILEQINVIHSEYIRIVTLFNGTTPGLDWLFITKNIRKVVEHLDGRPIIAAGFYALSGAEDILFRKLWEEGILTPVIHGDPALAHGDHPHWSAVEHTRWLARWKTTCAIPHGLDTPSSGPDIRFCEGYDRHSQLAGLTDDLGDGTGLDDSAIVLPDEGALLPVLHHLPDVEPNISMGYPLDRTSLARLIETLLTLQENRLDDGRYYWRDVVALIRHPYLRLLGPEDKPLRKIFQVWETVIRKGERYLAPDKWSPPYGDKSLDGVDSNVAQPLFGEILNRCLTAFESVTTLVDLADALAGLAITLHTHGERLWHTYLVDAECLFRLTNSVIPQLKDAKVSSEEFSRTTLHSLLRQMLTQERVSFEPEPLAGLQVLGVLETRLLHFRRLYILDAVEDRLPGTNPFDPLLPDPLRKLLGLPDARERDNVSGYNFYRLLMGAKEAVIYYQNGIQPGLLDSKSVRSRFVEQLIWDKEKRNKRLMKSGDAHLRAVTFPAGAPPTSIHSIPVTDAVRKRLLTTLADKGLSPSRLDVYLHCPKRFFYQYLTDIRPIVQMDEEGDRSEFGSLMHEVLREFLTPYIGRTADLSALDPVPLLALFDKVFTASDFFAGLPLDTRMALTQTSRHRLTQFLASQEPATILELEKSLETTMEIDGHAFVLSGQLDRIEDRENGTVILDYKTGGGQVPQKGFWTDDELWDRISTYGPDVIDPMLLPDIARAMRSVQLPVYLHLHARQGNETPYDAGLIHLAEDGKTQYLFGPKWTEQERTEAVDDMAPLLINTLVRHMLLATHFAPQPGPQCKWCDFSKPCGQ